MTAATNRGDCNRVEIERPWPDGGAIWFGRNAKRHGGEFFIGLSGGETASLRIPDEDRERVADLLERAARAMRTGRFPHAK